MEDDLKLQDFDQWVKIFILKHEGENLSKESKISGHPNVHLLNSVHEGILKKSVNILNISASLCLLLDVRLEGQNCCLN